MKSCYLILALIGLLHADAAKAQAQSGSLPPEAEQVLFLIDDSWSMTETAFDPNAPRASRWELLQRVFPQWMNRLGQKTLVGALSVGGECGEPPAISLPVGSDRTSITEAIAKAQPHGNTNLNAALLAAPGLFAPGVRGSQRIILLSDGINSCAPHRPTCEIAQELHRDHGIIIDVVAWITEPKMVDEFRCVAAATGGTFTAPQNFKDFLNIQLPGLDPWPYVVLALGFATLLLAARILYRHGIHVLVWETGVATLAGGLLLLLGALTLYLVLFVKAGLAAALLGGVVLMTLLAVASRQGKGQMKGHTLESGSPSPWSTIGVVLLGCLLVHQPAVAGDAAPTMAATRTHHHHILVLDMSVSVVEFIEDMKSLMARYTEIYTLPGDEISLVVFAMDEAGSVKELRTFTVPQNGATDILNRLLDDLSIQNSQPTRTYFKPVADFLNQFLQNVRLDPVVVVISDGKSDGFADTAKGLVDFNEIPFESLGQRGVYAAPGTNWKVAIAGGSDLDLTALFQNPLPRKAGGGQSGRGQRPYRLSPALDPDLIDPNLLVETDDTLILRPTWNPFSHQVHGTLSIFAHHASIARFRTFHVEIRRGKETLPLGSVDDLIEPNAKAFAFPVTWEATAQDTGQAIVQILIDQGKTTRTIYPQRPATLKMKKISYWQAFGVPLLGVSVAVLGLGVLVTLTLQRRRQGELNRPEIIRTLDGQGIPLRRLQSITIGGEGCSVSMPDVPPGQILATAAWTGTRGQLTLQSEDGIRMKIDGRDVTGSTIYSLGQQLQLINADGKTYDVPLHQGNSKSMGFGTTRHQPRIGCAVDALSIWSGGNGGGAGSAFTDFGGIHFPDAGIFSNPSGSGVGTNPDTYI